MPKNPEFNPEIRGSGEILIYLAFGILKIGWTVPKIEHIEVNPVFEENFSQ